MKFLPESEIVAHTGSENENLPILTFFMISWSLAPLNGGIPERIIYVMTPQDQISHFSLYDLFKTSGAI